MKFFGELWQQLTEAKEDDTPLEPSYLIDIRPLDMRHKTPGITVMIKRHKNYRTGREAYDWSLKEPVGARRKYYGTIKKRRSGGWIALATDGNLQSVEIDTHGDSLKAIRKVYKSISKMKGSTALNLPLIARGNARKRPLTR